MPATDFVKITEDRHQRALYRLAADYPGHKTANGPAGLGEAPRTKPPA